MKTKEIEKEAINLECYINPFREREYLLFLLSRIHQFEKGIEEFLAYGPIFPKEMGDKLQKLLDEE
jgi:hypothetical protein